MTRSGMVARLYSELVEVAPSRFADPAAYRSWRERAMAWGEIHVDEFGNLLGGSGTNDK